MINPYALSAINIFLSVGLFILVVYRYIINKNKLNLLVLLIIISLLPAWSIFRPGVYESGDFSIHVTQAVSFYKSLSEGVLFPRWAGNLNANYGFPAFMFIYPLPYYVISLFHFVGFSFILSTKLLLFFSFIFSGIGMYLWIKSETNELGGFIAGVFYLFAPYHLVDLHFRSDIGETLAFAVFPFIMLFLNRLYKNYTTTNFTILSLLYALLILSHPAISLASVILIFPYLIFLLYLDKSKNYKKIVTVFLSFLFGILLSAFYWLPTISEIVYTHQVADVTFENFNQFIYSPWRLGFLFQGPKGQLSFLIGYVQILIICYVFVSTFFLKKHKSKLITFLISLFFVYLLLMQHISQPLWNILPFIKNFQFTYRLSFYTAFLSSAIAGLLLYKLKDKKVVFLLCSLAIILTVLNWGNRRVIPTINDATIIRQLPLSTYKVNGLAQASPIWTDAKNPWMSSIPQSHLELLKGRVEIKQVSIMETEHVYLLSVNKTSSLRENTIYFPGWNLYVNNKSYPIQISKQYPMGSVLFKINPGLYKLNFRFEDTAIIKTSQLISLLTLLLLFGFISKSYFVRPQ